MIELNDIEKEILTKIHSMSGEVLFKNFKPLKVSGIEDKKVTYAAFKLYENGLIKASIMKHNIGVEGVIPKGLTAEGEKVLNDSNKSKTEKIFENFKKSFEEKLADKIASGFLILIGMFLMFIIQYLYKIILN